MRRQLRRWSAAVATALFAQTYASGAAEGPWLVDVSDEVGLDITYDNGMSGALFFVELIGPGAALFDYDNDGDLDLFVPQGHRLDPKAAPSPGTAPRDRLLRNDLERRSDGTVHLRFTDVSKQSQIEAKSVGYGIGVAAADFDNDGWVDLYVSNWGPNRLWRNRGDGTFADVTEKAGVGDDGWSTSAAFADLDGDGWLELYVTNYVEYDFQKHRPCFAPSSMEDYCGPKAYRPAADRLYGNRGNGIFAEVPLELTGPRGAGLGVVSGDFDDNGYLDLYVANDGGENHLWLSQGKAGLVDDALLAGVAVNSEGKEEASMGLAVADFDNDGDEDIFVTHLSGESNTLYVNDGQGVFDDRSQSSGLGSLSFPLTGFGTGFLDLDGDNLLDLFIANGDVHLIPEQVAMGLEQPMTMVNQIYRNRGSGRFEEISERIGELSEIQEVSRGVALGDVDNDGDVDIVLANNTGQIRLLENRAPRQSPGWLGLELVMGSPPRPALGARATIRFSEGRTLHRRVRPDGSYCSSSDPRIVVSIPQGRSIREIEVWWPDRVVEVFPSPAAGRYSRLEKGAGRSR